MRNTLLLGLVVLCLGSQVGWAATCEWRWDPVTTNADGTPVTDLAGYRLYVDTVRRTELALTALPDPTQPGMALPCAAGERWHVTAYDRLGNESPPSNVVEVPASEPVDTLPPGAPTGFRAEKITMTVEFQLQ